jgi:hypothetical protein
MKAINWPQVATIAVGILAGMVLLGIAGRVVSAL